MKDTSPLQKLGSSAVLAFLTFLCSFPFYFLFGFNIQYKITVVAIFFIISIVSLLLRDGRDVGMLIFGTYWEHSYRIWQKIVYSILYAASFATLLFWIRFPLDIFLINILFFQLPCVIITGTTLHGYLSGGMKTVAKSR